MVAGDAVAWISRRDAAVDHIDDAADGGGAVKQSGRSVQHLDPVGEQRIDRRLAWSAEVAETSKLPMPSVSSRMRSPEKPRRIGREALGPKEEAVTPGWRASVSPRLGRRSRARLSPLRTDAASQQARHDCAE